MNALQAAAPAGFARAARCTARRGAPQRVAAVAKRTPEPVSVRLLAGPRRGAAAQAHRGRR
jgi:hypothetical protein